MLFANIFYAKWISLDLLAVPKDQFKPMVYRSISGLFGNSFLFISTQFFPLTFVTTLAYLCPMITAGMGFMFLSETLSVYDVGSIFIAFFGVLIVVFNPYKDSNSSVTYDIKWWYYIFPLCNPLFESISSLLMRYLGQNVHCIMAPTFLGVTLGMFVPIFAFFIISIKQIATEYNTIVMLYILAIGSFGTIAQIFNSRALQIEKAGRIQGFNYMTIVFMLTADLLIFDIPIQWLDLIGIAAILGSNFFVASLKACGWIK